mmetsp:Transcript_22867/g.35189  ORF Transcript_22867/g.35189 Transcript_22867/m.35189 type:complete len:102 (+) Transcript_22867:255-560(+)
MKEKLEGQSVDTFRTRLQEVKFNWKQKKSIDENQYCQMAMALLLQIERCPGSTLNEEELKLKQWIQSKGLNDKIIGDGNVGAKIGKELADYSQDQVHQSKS